MTFVPQQHSPNHIPPPLRRVMFWILMMGLAAFLSVVDSRSWSEALSPLLILFAGIAAVFLGWTAMYLLRKRSARRQHSSHGTSNRPLG
jgi:hypothetical protein